MDAAFGFYAQNAFWVWFAVAALLLAVEVATGSGWLLWPTASAAAVGVLTFFVRLGLPLELALFALLALGGAFVSRRFLPKRETPDTDADINDQRLRLVGRMGETVQDFVDGRGRVFVDGSEWAAEADAAAPLRAGSRVEVTGLAGARLAVRPG